MLTCGMCSKPRVLMIGPTPPAVGGMVSVMQTLVTSPLRHTVHLSVLSANPSWFRKWGPVGSLLRHSSLLFTLLWRVLRTRADIVHIHASSFFTFYRHLLDLAFLRLLRRRVLLHLHGGYFDDFYRRATGPGRLLIRAGLRKAHAVVVLSEPWRHWIGTVVPTANVHVIPNAVHMPELDPPRTYAPRPTCRFLYLGTLSEHKGLFDLLTATAKLRDDELPFEVILAGPWGSPGDGSRFTDALCRHGLNDVVRHAGIADGDERVRLLRQADVFILPSHREAMPVAILEAMSFALPVIATDVGAVVEAVPHMQAGLILSPHSPDRLAAAMRTLITDPDLRNTLGSQARRRAARHYNDNLQADAVLALYQSLLPPARAPALALDR
ncbi:MAG: glycosyltransferase family 4 protein [Phycisphaerales bacterium]|nr:MAG: glycosyltransferase family 4 protein [Phycisphaerales bacterium]